jgi:DNA-binding NarL/FixJ family response regulator
MQTTLQGMELSVAVLMDDLASAKEIASSLRQSDILAHHYQNLDEFWVACNIQAPDLVIVDVTKMSQGSVQFRQHPKVQDGSLCYVFYSKESTKVLLQSTYGLKPFGYIHNDPSLSVQLMCVVERRVEALKNIRLHKELEQRIQRLQARSQRMLSDRNAAEEFQAHFSFIRNFCAEIEKEAVSHDFIGSLMNKLEAWDAIASWGLYELNQSGQKLLSPEISRKKYHPLPSLWLGEANLYGIEKFAQEMAVQVANDLFESEPIMLKIHAGPDFPDMLLYLCLKDQGLVSFPWDVFESMLSSSLRRLKLRQQVPQYTSQFLPMWEALDSMDRIQRQGVEGDTRVLCLSFIPLLDVVKRRIQNKFYWSAFFNDFFTQLSGRMSKQSKLSLFGPWQVLFFIPREQLEAEFQMLNNFVRQFSYWKFFEDNSQILSEEMLPVIKLTPASSAHYLRLFEKEFEELAASSEGKRLLTLGHMDSKRLTL